MILKYFTFILISFLFISCNNNKDITKYNGKQLLEEKCSSCHNLDLPGDWEANKLAPPIMAVSFHVYDLVDKDITSKINSSEEFIIDYVLNPNEKKSICDKKSLKQYGLMPSQKNNISKDELRVIAKYMLSFYTKENLYKIQKQQEYLKLLKPGHRIAIKYKCLSCHKIYKNLVGPSFKDISLRTTIEDIKYSIKNGSKNRWSKAIMPKFNNISKEELNILSKWIKNIK